MLGRGSVAPKASGPQEMLNNLINRFLWFRYTTC